MMISFLLVGNNLQLASRSSDAFCTNFYCFILNRSVLVAVSPVFRMARN